MLCESGTPYQTLEAPVWLYSIQGSPWGSRYQHPVVKSIPTCNVGTVTPIIAPMHLNNDLMLLERIFNSSSPNKWRIYIS